MKLLVILLLLFAGCTKENDDYSKDKSKPPKITKVNLSLKPQ